MIQWYTFLQPDNFDPEIRVGLYDQWLLQVGFGPTQAERVLVHTDMMSLAHERRFVVGQLEQSMADFAVHHSEYMARTIEILEGHLASSAKNTVASLSDRGEEDLIGLSTLSATINSMSNLFQPTLDIRLSDLTNTIGNSAMVEAPTEQMVNDKTATHIYDTISVDEEADLDVDQLKEWREDIRQASKASRSTSFRTPRQLAPKRIRRHEPIRCTNRDGKRKQ